MFHLPPAHGKALTLYVKHLYPGAGRWIALKCLNDMLHTSVQINPSSLSTLMALPLRASWQNVLSPINLQRFQEEISGGIKPLSCHRAGWRWKHVVLFVLRFSSLDRGRSLAGQQPRIRKWWSAGGFILRHIPCCSADSKKAVITFHFFIDKVLIAFWLLFIWAVSVCMCVSMSVKACWSNSTYRERQHIYLLTC